MTNQNPTCSICGGTTFTSSLAGRIAKNGQPPKCANCGGLERHRIVRKIMDSLPLSYFDGKSALQFSNDPSFPCDKLAKSEISIFDGENSLDITNINRPDNSFDWIIANHVLEHVENDKTAIKELIRVVKTDGLIQITIPTPHSQLWTEDWGHATTETYGHYRGYGSDFPVLITEVAPNISGIQVIGWDSVVLDRWEIVYFISQSRDSISQLGKTLFKQGFPVIAINK